MNAATLRTAAAAWFAAARPAVLVQVQSHRGSVPRESGTLMLVSTQEVLGSIGGGHLELQAIQKARTLLPQGPGATPIHQSLSLGPSLGQCCGGSLSLRYIPLSQVNPADPAHAAVWTLARPRFDLQLYGAGHVGRAIVRLLVDLPCRVQWIDERDSEFPGSPLPAHIEAVCTEPVQAEVAQAQAGAFYLVLTHSHELDLAITLAVMQRGDFGFFWSDRIQDQTRPLRASLVGAGRARAAAAAHALPHRRRGSHRQRARGTGHRRGGAVAARQCRCGAGLRRRDGVWVLR